MRSFLIPAAVAAVIVAAPAAAQPAAQPARTLVVTGQGEAVGEPDMLTLSIGVETQGETAAAALSQNAAQLRAAVDRLKKRGVAERDIQTANLSVNPRYDYETRPGAPMLVGYAASNTLTVKLRDIDKAGAVIDETVKEGANTLGGLSFGFENADPLFDKARAAAVADARDRAELLAKAAGVELGPILQIREGVDAGGPVPVFDGRVAMAEAKSTVVAAGESTVTATVTLVYEIQ